MPNNRNNRITEACQVYLGGWLNLEMVLCEIDCELEFMNPLYSTDTTSIDYSLEKNVWIKRYVTQTCMCCSYNKDLIETRLNVHL